MQLSPLLHSRSKPASGCTCIGLVEQGHKEHVNDAEQLNKPQRKRKQGGLTTASRLACLFETTGVSATLGLRSQVLVPMLALNAHLALAWAPFEL